MEFLLWGLDGGEIRTGDAWLDGMDGVDRANADSNENANERNSDDQGLGPLGDISGESLSTSSDVKIQLVLLENDPNAKSTGMRNLTAGNTRMRNLTKSNQGPSVVDKTKSKRSMPLSQASPAPHVRLFVRAEEIGTFIERVRMNKQHKEDLNKQGGRQISSVVDKLSKLLTLGKGEDGKDHKDNNDTSRNPQSKYSRFLQTGSRGGPQQSASSTSLNPSRGDVAIRHLTEIENAGNRQTHQTEIENELDPENKLGSETHVNGSPDFENTLDFKKTLDFATLVDSIALDALLATPTGRRFASSHAYSIEKTRAELQRKVKMSTQKVTKLQPESRRYESSGGLQDAPGLSGYLREHILSRYSKAVRTQ